MVTVFLICGSALGREADPSVLVEQVKMNPAQRPASANIDVEIPDEGSIPLLDVEPEPRLNRHDLFPRDLALSASKYKNVQRLATPALLSKGEMNKWRQRRAQVAKGPRPKIRQQLGFAQPVTDERIAAVNLNYKPTPESPLKPIYRFSEDELNFLTALILIENGSHCDVASGLLFNLVDHKSYGAEASFHLGLCAHKLGFYSESFKRLAPVIEAEHAEFAPRAVSSLLKNLPREYEAPMAKILTNLKNPKLIPAETRDLANLVIARGFYTLEDYKRASRFAALVKEKSDLYVKSQFLLGVSQFALNNNRDAEKILENLRNWMEKHGRSDKNISSLIAANLARLQFQEQRYTEANENYLKIEKSHPLWVQGLVEQGWTQIMMGDYAGAIGNMYSLHSPYFTAVFKPESYAVRTIGYINICQYGDAYRTLTHLEKQHRQWLEQVDVYTKEKKLARNYYDTVRQYLMGKSDKDVDGLPFQVIREMGRQRNFLNFQDSLNEKEDELVRYTKINSAIINEKAKVRTRLEQAQQRFSQVRANLEKAKTDKSLAPQVSQWKADFRNERELILAYRYRLAVYERGRQGYLNLKAQAEQRIDKEKYDLREGAGRALVKALASVREQMRQVLDNNEFLRYEVFAGSGENIRYQAAGGEVTGVNRIPAHIKPEKNLNWQFDGEYWEDEIGSYRSSLKNNCPTVRGGGIQPLKGDQAAWKERK